MRPPIAGSTLLSAHPAGMRRCGYDTRSMPGQESNPESKLRIRLMPALCMTATCNASLADRSCRVSSSERDHTADTRLRGERDHTADTRLNQALLFTAASKARCQ